MSQRVWSLIESTQCVQESFWVDKNDLHGQDTWYRAKRSARDDEKRSKPPDVIDASVRIRLRCRQQPSEKLMFEILVTRVKLRRFEKTKHVAKALESGRD